MILNIIKAGLATPHFALPEKLFTLMPIHFPGSKLVLRMLFFVSHYCLFLVTKDCFHVNYLFCFQTLMLKEIMVIR